jgi:NAD-dependent deacetylase
MDELTPFAVHNATGVRVPASLILALRGARHVAVLTGAGVSAESGIPTFRDALTGLWERFNAEQLATPAAFQRDPDLVWGWYEWRRMKVLRAQPNPAHIAIAVMQRQVPRLTLITQNVDDLHERSGSTDVIHLHGSLHAPRCFTCARPHRLVEGVPEEPEGGRRLPPLRCAHCGEAIRPGVVWFGEPLPQDAWEAAERAAENCDLLFCVGTSSLVYPAAGLPHLAARKATAIVQVNPNPTELDSIATFSLRGPAGAVLPMLIAATWKEARTYEKWQ